MVFLAEDVDSLWGEGVIYCHRLFQLIRLVLQILLQRKVSRMVRRARTRAPLVVIAGGGDVVERLDWVGVVVLLGGGGAAV